MLSMISSIIVAICRWDDVKDDGYEVVLNDPSYLGQIIECTFILECLVGLIRIIRKVVKH